MNTGLGWQNHSHALPVPFVVVVAFKMCIRIYNVEAGLQKSFINDTGSDEK